MLESEFKKPFLWKNKTVEETVIKLIRDKKILEFKNNHHQTKLKEMAFLCEEKIEERKIIPSI
jgi:hypothetical protein